MNRTDITVAIPTYNGANRLPDLLKALQNQTGTEFHWEIIVVDNNSTDNTREVVQKYENQWQLPYPLKYCFEAQQGAGYARKRAIELASGNLIAFLDDDNYPYPNWVAAAYRFAKQHPQSGAFGSQIHPEWEVEPPKNFSRIAPFLAITERGNIPLLYEPRKNLLPPSSGLVIRRQAYLSSVPEKQTLTGRTSNNMLTGEDLEMLCYIKKAGWEIWYNPEMEINHKIPKSRLQEAYLIPFFRGIGLSRYVTRTINVKQSHKPFILLAHIINDLYKISLHLVKYRSQINNDLVAKCEMQLLLSSLYSPFYFINKV